MVSINIPNETDEEREKREERNRKRRERYASQSGGTVKETKSKSKSKNNDNETIEMIAQTMTALSCVISSKPVLSPLMLNYDESLTMTKAFFDVMKDNEKLSQIAEQTKGLPLLLAVVSIMLPKIIMTVTLIKQENHKKEVVKNVRKNTDNQSNAELIDKGRTVESSSRHDNPIPSTNGSFNGMYLGSEF